MKDKYVIFADGSSPHVLKWVKELVKYFDLYLISLNGVMPEISPYIDEKKVFVLNESVKSSGGNYALFFKLPKLKALIKEIAPKYINAHYLSSYGFLAAIIKNIYPRTKLIQSTWGSDVLVEPFTSVVRNRVAKYSLRQADYISSDSYSMAEVIVTLMGSEKEILVFPFGLNKSNEAIIYQKERLVFSNRALKPLYNLDKILYWFAKQKDDLRLVVANDGPEKTSLINLSESLGVDDRVEFVGFLSQEEQKEYYIRSKYFISIPSSDATSVSLLEAMFYGCAPLVSNIPANREWILDGVNGAFFHEKMDLSSIEIPESLPEINMKIIEKRACFPKCIENFILKVSQ